MSLRREYWIDADLNRLPKPCDLTGNLFREGDAGDRIGVRVYRDGKPEILTGSIKGYIILPDKSMINQINGEREGNAAWVDLPAAACASPGLIEIFVKMEENASITTLGTIKAKVCHSI